MGPQDRDSLWTVRQTQERNSPPDHNEIEVTLLGPGYGESVVLHIGSGTWVIVDSCINHEGNPQALEYLESIGVDPVQSVDLVVATHWHDDHIRGMSRLVEVCTNAQFCCGSALSEKEFLAAVDALERRHFSGNGSGVREIHRVFSQLPDRKTKAIVALANRRLYARGKCETWSLSPQDADVWNFLKSIRELVPNQGRTKIRLPVVTPNDVAVVLWIRVDDTVVLLGSDLEKEGWMAILQNEARPTDEASVFKVAHHGSAGAYAPGVWEHMLEPSPFAVLTPWRRGGRKLPTEQDVQRILLKTENAFVTARVDEIPRARKRRDSVVTRTLRESEIKLRGSLPESGAVRLRRQMNTARQWSAEMFGPACHLNDQA